MISKDTIPVPPWKGLYLDGPTVPGGLSRAENVIILEDGSAERRPFERTLADTEACLSSRGTKEVFELLKADGTRYIYADIDNSEGYTSAFGVELVTGASALTAWTDVADWALHTDHWDHGGTGTTSLVGKPAVTAATLYRLVVDVTCPVPAATAEWVYAHTDSTYNWTTKEGNSLTVWLNTWTHSTNGTAALTCPDFTPAIGASYVVRVGITHTSGTGVSIAMGGIAVATNIAASGFYTYIVRHCSSAALLTFTPANDWRGSINKTWPRFKQQLPNAWVSVVKLIDPAGPDHPSNYDYTASTYTPKSMYMDGAELTYYQPTNWYPAAAAYSGQSLAVYLGGTLAGTITASGVYSYDVTTAAATTTAVTFTPTTAWAGSVNSCSIMAMTQAAAATKCKVIGGTVTGTTDYETTWGNILTDLTTGDTVHPCWTALQDRAFRVDGTNKNYWFENATTYHTLGCPAPTDAPVTASTTGGELVAADYNVYYTYVKKYGSGESLYVVEGNPSPAAYTTVAGTAITVSLIACTESDVSHIRIYRTLYGEPGSFAYMDTETTNATKTVTLIAADDIIGDGSALEFNHDMPPKLKYALGAGSRLWGIDTQGALVWSKIDQPEIFPVMNFMTFDPKDGDVVMGLCPLRKHVLVFKRRRTWLFDMFSESVSDDGTASLAKDVVSSNIGCIASGSIQPVGTDSAIWLSHAGFIKYDGGTITNISAGDKNTGVPSRIQNVINAFMADGAENFIDSAYHTARQLYHVNFLTRNSAGTTITEQRHFVYNLVTDTWTEYVYRNSAGTKQYETNFAMAHDSLGNEVLLIPYVSGTTGTVTYVYQGEYDIAVTIDKPELIMDADGAGGAAETFPRDSFCDGSDNVYVITKEGYIFKITDAGVKSLIISAETLTETIPGLAYKDSGDVASITETRLSHVDLANSCFYVRCDIYLEPPTIGYAIFKISLTGTPTLIKYDTSDSIDGTEYTYNDYYSASSFLFILKNTITSGDSSYSILKITNPGAGQTESTYYDLYANGFTGTFYRLQIFEDDLYVQYFPEAGGNLKLVKFTTITGTATPTVIDTGISGTIFTFGNFAVVSGTEIILIAVDVATGLKSTIYKLTYANSTWTNMVVVGAFSHSVSYSENLGASLIKNTTGDFIVGGVGNYIYIYNSDWQSSITIAPWLVDDTLTEISGITGVSYFPNDENMFIVCGNNVDIYPIYKFTSGIIVLGDTEPTMKNTIAHIVSNYNDLGIANEKRICRAYMNIDCKYPGCGSFTIEPDYRINSVVHTYGETTEPDGATSMRPFQHDGHKTFVYTNDQFDDDVEQWQLTRLDVGIRGAAIRYAIRIGDVTTNVTGLMRIKPPMLDVQIKTKQ